MIEEKDTVTCVTVSQEVLNCIKKNIVKHRLRDIQDTVNTEVELTVDGFSLGNHFSISMNMWEESFTINCDSTEKGKFKLYFRTINRKPFPASGNILQELFSE